ncbi:uncharacterized protein METZ01_LOCUS335736 [marine metagenome]|uniref:Uncharacterized protein n=1 Tax=marine metagenome TaxID=408172 RepID=A0A382QE51_9ZZZZ
MSSFWNRKLYFGAVVHIGRQCSAIQPARIPKVFRVIFNRNQILQCSARVQQTCLSAWAPLEVLRDVYNPPDIASELSRSRGGLSHRLYDSTKSRLQLTVSD